MLVVFSQVQNKLSNNITSKSKLSAQKPSQKESWCFTHRVVLSTVSVRPQVPIGLDLSRFLQLRYWGPLRRPRWLIPQGRSSVSSISHIVSVIYASDNYCQFRSSPHRFTTERFYFEGNLDLSIEHTRK